MQGFLQHPTAPTNPYLLALLTDQQTPLPFKWTTNAPLKVFFDDTGSRPWSAAEKSAALSAFLTWQRVTNIDFVVTTDRAQADIIQTLSPSTTFLGVADLPGATPPSTIQYSTAGTNFDTINRGGDTFQTMVHEIGHVIGLAHPHDGVVFPGVTGEQSSGTDGLNQHIWTAMSYVVGYNLEPTTTQAYGTNFTPMAFDIAAIQFLYGARVAETGDNTYFLPTANAVGTGWSAIWDTGGTDTINGASAQTALTINLKAAPLTGPNAGGYVSWVGGIKGGFTIANGVIIENAIGGNGNDTITGNSANNFINGLAGSDTVVFAGPRDGYAIFTSSQGLTIVADSIGVRDGKDTLQNVESLTFDGQTLSLVNALVEPLDADNSNFQVYRFYNSQTASHFFTTSVAERNSVIENLAGFSYEGNAFDSNASAGNGTAVYRFLNTANNVHFYTANAGEAEGLRQNASFRDEGISYYASSDGANGGTALYRFFNTLNGSHFYTVSSAERDNIIGTLGHYNYEGIAFFVDLA